MEIKPILFNTEMVRAILNGRKTQTRRTKGLESKNEYPNEWNREGDPKSTLNRIWDSTIEKNPNPISVSFGFNNEGYAQSDDIAYIKSSVKPGDILWVRETFYKPTAPELNGGYYYKASIDDGWELNWKPSIFMPKAACRIFLEVTDVRVERLQDISNEDAIAEGISDCVFFKSVGYRHYTDPSRFIRKTDIDAAKICFYTLWMSINGPQSLDKNPWVWVYEFKQVEKPKNFLTP